MAALGFEVHVDKENTVSSGKNSVSRFGSKQVNKQGLVRHTSRKALLNVNKDPAQLANRSEKQDPFLFKPPATVKGVENKLSLQQENEISVKKAQKIHNGQTVQSSKTKSLKKKKKVQKKQEASPVENVEYDSDTIFPRQERLSSYVDKLLTWRPPCLFGSLPDSDTELNEEPQLWQEEDLEMPTIQSPPYVPGEIEALMQDLPPLSPLDMGFGDLSTDDHLTGGEFEESLTADIALTSTPNVSISLGTLEMYCGQTTPTKEDTTKENVTSDN